MLFRSRPAPGRFFVLHDPEGFYVFSWACTHLGNPLDWLDRNVRFECPVHGAQFARDGSNLAGPAPRPMDLFEARFNRDGDLVVDTSRRIIREEVGPDDALAPLAGASVRLAGTCPCQADAVRAGAGGCARDAGSRRPG